MKIHNKDFYYGVALTQIAEYPTFTSINKVTEKDGLYQINRDKRVLIKYSTSDSDEWRFSFRKDDLEALHSFDYEVFCVLVCSDDTICLLSNEDITELLDGSVDSTQWVSVTYPYAGQMRVRGSQGDLSHTVAHNAFPKEIFGEVKEDFSWPPYSKLNFYRNPPGLMISSEDRRLDLSDTLTNSVTFEQGRTVYLGVSTISHTWDVWDEETIKKIEEKIRYDLEFDGFNVEIERITNAKEPKISIENINCDNEFLWKLDISVALNDYDDTGEPNIRYETETFPNLILSKGKPVCSIEIDVDLLTQEENFKHGGWEDLIREIAAKWVKENSYNGTGTIWAFGSPSINFHHQSYSMFYAVLGMPKNFRDYLSKEIKILGEHVRPHSDSVIPNPDDGWDVRCQIEDGSVWGILDDVSWFEITI